MFGKKTLMLGMNISVLKSGRRGSCSASRVSTRFLPSDTRFEVPRRGLLDAEPLPSASVSFLTKLIQFCSSPAGMRSGFVKTPKRKLARGRGYEPMVHSPCGSWIFASSWVPWFWKSAEDRSVGYQKSNNGEKGRHTFAGNSQEGDGAWPFDVRRRQVLNEFNIFGISSHADARNRSYVHANFR